jgi:predicted ATPase/DNA-binding CsgD family transcriptional regulator
VRLLTLTGAGGVGKTRLALQVTTALGEYFADGVTSVPLAPISDPDLIIPTIAQALGTTGGGAGSFLALLQAALRDKHLLLLLDNFEQVLPAAPQLTELLAVCPDLKLLVTSRAVLHVQGEHEFPVPPLALPNLTQLPEPEVLSDYAAIALFLQRAQAALPTFELTAANASAIAGVCVHLDGLPLAIELAAARIKLLPTQALLARLGHRLEILTSGAQDVPARQQTLCNTITWSYQLLDAQEQRLFRLLSTFVGGCSLQAIEAVVAAQDKSNGAGWVLNGVASLLDKSLLQQTEQEGGEPRLVMLETIREYGLEVLEASGEVETSWQAHAHYYLALAEEAEPQLHGAEQARWLDRLDREQENLRAALQRSMTGGDEEVEHALRLGRVLAEFWFVRGHASDGRRWLEWVQTERRGSTAVRAGALIQAATLAHWRDEYELAQALSSESLSVYRELGDAQGMANALFGLGNASQYRGDYATARTLLEEALALFRQVGDQRGAAYALAVLAYTDLGDFQRARAYAEEALALFRAQGDQQGILYALWRLVRCLYLSQADLATTLALAQEMLALSLEVGFKQTIAYAHGCLGNLALQRGEEDRARSHLEEALAIHKEIWHPWGIALGIYDLAGLSMVQHDYTTARSSYEEGLQRSNAIGDKVLLVSCLEGLAAAVVAQGAEEGPVSEFFWAAQLWGAAERLREVIERPMYPIQRASYEQAIALARAELGEQAFAAAWAEGQMLTPEQALVARGKAKTPTPMAVRPTAAPPMKSFTSPAGLTAREVEVLRLIAQGWTDAQIAERLVISSRTVNRHTTSLYSKLGVSSRSAATRYALEHHVL